MDKRRADKAILPGEGADRRRCCFRAAHPVPGVGPVLPGAQHDGPAGEGGPHQPEVAMARIDEAGIAPALALLRWHDRGDLSRKLDRAKVMVEADGRIPRPTVEQVLNDPAARQAGAGREVLWPAELHRIVVVMEMADEAGLGDPGAQEPTVVEDVDWLIR